MLNKIIVPRHIAIIMDGNGRWAKKRGLPRTAGHRAGIDSALKVMESASKMGVECLSFFAFSSENWSRPRGEVDLLMRYLDNFLKRRLALLNKNNIRFRWIGRRSPLAQGLLKRIALTEELTAKNSGMTAVLALNYGSRQEIVDAAKKIAALTSEGKLTAQDVDETFFESLLYTAGLPDPDLLIRTSGAMRVSNFLLWQISYAELYFVDKFWPDFGPEDLEGAIEAYRLRERRFGRIDAG